MSAVVVLSPGDLEELVERAVQRALNARPSGDAKGAKVLRRLFTVPQACREFSIGRSALMALINSGKLRSTMRKMRGGREGHILRAEDCERVLAGVR
jgi:hypothetical protein